MSRDARGGPWMPAGARRSGWFGRRLALTGVTMAAVVVGTALSAALAGSATAPDGEVLGLAAEPTMAAATALAAAPEAPLSSGRAGRRGLTVSDRFLVPEARFAEPPAPLPPSRLAGYRWPLAGGRVTGTFGPSWLASRIVNGERFHDGLDLASFCGDRVLAAHDGVVLAASRRFDAFMGWQGDLQPYLDWLDAGSRWGWLPITVVIDDGNGYRSVYAHLGRVIVKPGQRVEAGRIIGYEGATGRASGCHLHYGLFSPYETSVFEVDPAVVKRMRVPAAQTARIDPLLVLPARPSREPARGPADPLEPEDRLRR